MRIILASQSPRRKELMEAITKDFEIIVSNADEKLEEGLTIEEQAKNVSYQKAKAVFDRTEGNRVIIGSDTMVVKNNKIYGKPKTKEEAKEAADKLPKPKSVVYQKIDEKTYKRTVCGIYGHYVGNVYDLVIRFEDGKEVSTKEIGISIFLTESAEKQ